MGETGAWQGGGTEAALQNGDAAGATGGRGGATDSSSPTPGVGSPPPRGGGRNWGLAGEELVGGRKGFALGGAGVVEMRGSDSPEQGE